MAIRKLLAPKALATIFIILLFVYSYPRILLSYFAKDNPWLNYLYMYGYGFVFFAFGIWLVLKTKACQPGRGNDTFWFKSVLAGFVFFASLHAFWIYIALAVPFKGS